MEPQGETTPTKLQARRPRTAEKFERLGFAIGTLYSNSDYADMVIKYGDRLEIRAHRAIVCSQSAWFRQHCLANVSPVYNGKTEIVDLNCEQYDASAVEAMIRWFYTAEISLPRLRIKSDVEAALAHLRDIYKLAVIYDTAYLCATAEEKYADVLTCCCGERPVLLAEELAATYNGENPLLEGLRDLVREVAAERRDELQEYLEARWVSFGKAVKFLETGGECCVE